MNEHTKFHIQPQIGTNSIKFGMTPEDAINLLGPSEATSINHQGKTIEFRSFMNVAYSNKNQIDHIGFGRQMQQIYLGRINIFQNDSKAVLRELINIDSNVFSYFGFLFFFKLGFSLTGFHDDNKENKALALFPPGSWDSRKSKMKPFVFG